jgi:bis(5'-nucleosidyl)-tetraphosphatase
MQKHKSVGVVLRNSSTNKYLVLHYPSGHWDYAKGHVEEGETEEQTLRRELKEETGITRITLIEGFKEAIKYHFKQDGNLIDKEVVFYLAETDEEDVKISYEHKDHNWLDYKDALEKVTFKNAKELLMKAEEVLNKI